MTRTIKAPGTLLVLALLAFLIGPVLFSTGTQRCGPVWSAEYASDSTVTAAKVRAGDTVYANDVRRQREGTRIQCVTDVRGANEGAGVMRAIGAVVTVVALLWIA